MIPLELYRVFYFTAKEGSLSKAADKLFITQPAVTHAIKQLEGMLEGKLFVRNSRGVTLTGEGQVLFTYIEQAYNFIMSGERKWAEIQHLESGEIRIGASDTLCKYYLLPHLEAFHKLYPAINIQVTNRTTPETVKLLTDGAIDCGIVSLPIDDNRLSVAEVKNIQDIFVVGPKYKELSHSIMDLTQLAQYPVILLEKGTNTRRFIDLYARGHGVALDPDIELGSIDLLVQFAKIGLGISCVIRDFVIDELANETLYELKLNQPIPPRTIGVITLQGVPVSASARKFLEQLAGE